MEAIQSTVRYECRSRTEEGRNVHTWVDHRPEEPHWPDSAVMRWDTRPDDWHNIWPELIDHPCALLFAPKHPHRSGPPVFKDWVQSWPADYEWETKTPEQFHSAIRIALHHIASGAQHIRDLQLAISSATECREDACDSDPSSLVNDLAITLRELDDSKRSEVAQLLSAFALAPDSAIVAASLKSLLVGQPQNLPGAGL